MGSLMLRLILCALALLACPTFGQPTQADYTQTATTHTQSSNGLEDRISSAAPPNCFIRCSFPPSRSQQEIDIIARDMTNQIIADMRNGQLNQQQLSQPYWFEQRVSDRLNQLNQEQEHVRKFYHQLGYEDDRLARQRELLDVQRQIFNNLNNRGQFGQNYNHQRHVQHQTNQFQEHTLNQVYPAAPRDSIRTEHEVRHSSQQINRNPVRFQYHPSHTTREKSSRTEERVVYNAPSSVMTIPGQQYYRNEENRRSEVVRQQPGLQMPVPTSQTKTISNHHQSMESIQSQPQPSHPILTPSSTFREVHNTEQRFDRVNQRPRLFAPRSEVTRNSTVIQTESEVRRPPIEKPIVTNQEYHRKQYEETRSVNQVKPTVVQVRPSTTSHQSIKTEIRSETHLPPTRVIRPPQERDEFYRHEQQHAVYENRVPTTQRPVLVFTDKPVRSEHRHNIYRFSEKTSDGIVPNYSPRVTLEQNMDLLEQRHHQNIETRSQVQPVTCNWTQRIEDLRLDLQRFNIQPFSQVQLNNTINSGFFREGNTVFVYNVANQHFEPTRPTSNTNTVTTITETRHLVPLSERPYEQLSQQEYQQRWNQLNDELSRLGYRDVQSAMLVEITRRGGFRHNGVKYCWVQGRIVQLDNQTTSEERVFEQRPVVVQRPDETHRVIETQEQEYEYKVHGLNRILDQIRVNNFNDFERNQTLDTGIFIRKGAKYTYNKSTHEYVGEILNQHEIDRIYNRIQQLMKYFELRQSTRTETAALLNTGIFYRGGNRWVYESNTGTLTRTEQVDQFQELTQDEYQLIFERIQQTLVKQGYAQMLEAQCNSTIVSGKFERGGIYYVYDAEQGIFVHEELNEETYNDRVRILREQLVQLGHRQISAEELHSIIYRGHFLYEGYRYEFNMATGRYEAIAITNQEYEARLQQLQEQLQTIGYTHMSLVECKTTIYTGLFYYNGYDWLYNYDTNVYVRSDEETSPPAHRDDDTEYSIVTERITEAPATSSERPKPTRGPVISKNRGDQPPQVFKDDYEDEEAVEYEPGFGYYPVSTEQPIPPIRVVQSGYEDQQINMVKQHHEYTEEDQRYEQEKQLRAQEDQRRDIEEQRRVREEQRRLYEEQLQVQEEQRQRDEELRRHQEVEAQAVEQARQAEERNRKEELRRQEQMRVHEELQRRQEELDRRANEVRQEEERKRVEELVREQNQDEGEEEQEEYEDNGEDDGENENDE